SFSPFETRVDSFCSGARVGPTAEIGAPGVREREFECSGKETLRLIPLPNPRPSLFRKLIVSPPPFPSSTMSRRQPCLLPPPLKP
ncbi:MAG: hypothetical protein JWN63_2120, partial [Candidatus Acidoferrum typicum]|nr:hypothetical protein [Candidatus Acidoferrum typicum]